MPTGIETERSAKAENQQAGTRHTTWEELAKQAEYRPSKLAKICGVSLRTLQRHFKRHYQSPVSIWLHQLKLTEAYAGVLAGKRIKEVAYDLGYKQLSHFSRDFKLAHGFSPSYLSLQAKFPPERPNCLP